MAVSTLQVGLFFKHVAIRGVLSSIAFFLKSEKLQDRKVSPNFSNFCPEFCPEFCAEFFPEFFEEFFVLRFAGNGDQKKFTKKSLPFFDPKISLAKHEKKMIFHKVFLESRQSNIFP